MKQNKINLPNFNWLFKMNVLKNEIRIILLIEIIQR